MPTVQGDCASCTPHTVSATRLLLQGARMNAVQCRRFAALVESALAELSNCPEQDIEAFLLTRGRRVGTGYGVIIAIARAARASRRL